MSGRSIEAGRAFLKLTVEDAAFKSGLDKSLAKLDAFGKSARSVGAKIGAVGAAITAPFVASLKIFSDTGSELTDLAGRTGLTVKALSELKYAAEQSGTGVGAVETAVKKMQRTLVDAAGGSQAAISALRDLGLTASDLAGKDPGDQFKTIARRISEIPDPAKRATAAMQVFGKSGTALLPMISQMDELIERGTKTGQVWDDEMAANADKLGDVLSDLKGTLLGVGYAIANAVAPHVTKITEYIVRSTAKVIEWVNSHGKLILIVGSAGAALTALAPIIYSVSAAVGVLTTSTRALTAAIAFLNANPVVALATVLGAAGVAALHFSGALDGLYGWLSRVTSGANNSTAAIDKLTEAIDGAAKATGQLTIEQKIGVKETEMRTFAAHPKTLAKLRKEMESLQASKRAYDIGQGRAVDQDADDPMGFGSMPQESVIGDYIKSLTRLLGTTTSKIDGGQQTIQEIGSGFIKGVMQGAPVDRLAMAKLADNVRAQTNDFARPFAQGTGGKFAEQIAGKTRAENLIQKTLELTKEEVKVLKEIKGVLQQAGVLIMGNS